MLSLGGVWIVAYYSGRTVRAARVLLALPVIILLSVPIVGAAKAVTVSGNTAYVGDFPAILDVVTW